MLYKEQMLMEGIFDINTATNEEVQRVIDGMLNAKNEWLESVIKREKELGLA